MRLRAALLLGPLALACHSARVATPHPASPLLGTWLDDYGSRYVISDTLLVHGSRNRYRIVEWHAAEQYLIAQNAADHPSDPGKWTRIDWLTLDGMPPYTWAYCFTAYRAPSADSARATPAANRATPRTGCNGFPFTRMRAGDTTATKPY